MRRNNMDRATLVERARCIAIARWMERTWRVEFEKSNTTTIRVACKDKADACSDIDSLIQRLVDDPPGMDEVLDELLKESTHIQ